MALGTIQANNAFARFPAAFSEPRTYFDYPPAANVLQLILFTKRLYENTVGKTKIMNYFIICFFGGNNATKLPLSSIHSNILKEMRA